MALQVEGSDQMRYLHHRMQRCPQDQANLARARQLALERQTAAPPAMHMRPLQVVVDCSCSAALDSSQKRCGVHLDQEVAMQPGSRGKMILFLA